MVAHHGLKPKREEMTLKEIQELAGHREVSPWVVKLVGDAVAKEREVLARFSQTLPNPYKHCQVSAHAYDMAILEYSRAIRARGNA